VWQLVMDGLCVPSGNSNSSRKAARAPKWVAVEPKFTSSTGN